jgi:hypothetical protein
VEARALQDQQRKEQEQKSRNKIWWIQGQRQQSTQVHLTTLPRALRAHLLGALLEPLRYWLAVRSEFLPQVWRWDRELQPEPVNNNWTASAMYAIVMKASNITSLLS